MSLEHVSKLRRLRGTCSLRIAAAGLGCSRSHLSEVERGLKRPSVDLLERASLYYGTRDLQVAPGFRPTGRAQLRERARQIRRRFGSLHRPRHTQPLRQAFALACYHEVGRQRLAELDRRKRPGIFWKAIKTMAVSMNGPEQGAFLALLEPDGEPIELHPRDLRFPIPIIERPGHWWLATALETGGNLVVVFSQLEVAPGPGPTRRLDFLVGVASTDTRGFVVVEIDGPAHAGRKPQDKLREREVPLPFVRFRTNEVWRREFRGMLLDKVIEKVHNSTATQG